VINLFGLTLGLTAAVTIFSIVRFELSYDTHHPDRDRIYRVVTEFTHTPKPGYTAGMTYPLPPALAQDFPEVEQITIVDCNMSDPVVTIPHADGSQQKFVESKVTFADPDYFKMFAYTWLEGNSGALMTEKSVVLTRSIAQKYFGDESALNQVINFDNDFDAVVSE
jgi:hypothetical protein